MFEVVASHRRSPSHRSHTGHDRESRPKRSYRRDARRKPQACGSGSATAAKAGAVPAADIASGAGGEPRPMLGQPAGRILPDLPKP
jgi:hypothetical protein